MKIFLWWPIILQSIPRHIPPEIRLHGPQHRSCTIISLSTMGFQLACIVTRAGILRAGLSKSCVLWVGYKRAGPHHIIQWEMASVRGSTALAISHWMIWCGPALLYPTQSTQLFDNPALKIPALVTMQASWKPIVVYVFFYAHNEPATMAPNEGLQHGWHSTKQRKF